MKPPIIPERPIPIVPDDGLRRLLAACAGKDFDVRRDTAIIMLLLDTGARRAELADLQLAHVDLNLTCCWSSARVVGSGRCRSGTRPVRPWNATFASAPVTSMLTFLVWPPDTAGTLPVILYMHGGGWVLGNADTHDRLVRELAVGAGAAAAFVEYDRSPEAHYPVALEQGYATARWIVREGAANQLDPDRIAVAATRSAAA
jgi:hypothetical protein